ncbi:MAG: Asp-tRNA(Asn)/Glu-tRNA(Gln) amidotransferase GatCAB subunit A, partial [Chloroflexi bacterium]|nr:Asp-tRNA(Asn)/Glu-tRNA(Gln) amidotransferase GatCAB subunit A [Chloroflexota bacterium]
MAQPHELSVVAAAAAIRARDLSPVELVASLLSRIESLDPALVAWAALVPDQALAAAREAERA